MSVLLVVADNLQEAENKISDTLDYLELGIEESEIYSLLNDIKPHLDKIDKGCADDFLYNLEIYGEETLSKDRIKNYLRLSEVLINDKIINYLDSNNIFINYYLNYSETDIPLKREDYIQFANKLGSICNQALKDNKTVFVFGE